MTLDFIERMAPGPELTAAIAAMEREGFTDYDRVVALKAYTRLASHYQAKAYEQIAAITELISEWDGETEEAFDSAVAEVRAALHLTRRTAETEVTTALQLCDRLPRVWEALAAGTIDLRRARVLTEGTSHLPVEVARRVVDGVMEAATRLTTGQLRALLRRVCLEADPTDGVERYETALSERRVFAEPTIDGTAHLMGLDLPPDRVAAVMRKLTHLAESLRRDGEDRSLDQLRADVFLDLLDGRKQTRGGRQGGVNLHVDLVTLAGLAENPGELGGFGPSSPTLLARSPNSSRTAHGSGQSPTPKLVNRSTTAPPDVDPLQVNDDRSKLATPPASSLAVVCPPPIAISTIGSPGPRADRPPPTTLNPSAGMTMSSDTKGGNTHHYRAAITSGPAASDTLTPPAVDRPKPGDTQGEPSPDCSKLGLLRSTPHPPRDRADQCSGLSQEAPCVCKGFTTGPGGSPRRASVDQDR